MNRRDSAVLVRRKRPRQYISKQARTWKMERTLKISIFGLGYVGAVSAGCLAAEGHQVLGVDPIADKVDLINGGHSPIVEAEISEIIEETVRDGRLHATQ